MRWDTRKDVERKARQRITQITPHPPSSLKSCADLGCADCSDELGPVLRDALVLCLAPHHEPRDVLQKDQGDLALAAKLTEGGRHKQGADVLKNSSRINIIQVEDEKRGMGGGSR